MRKIKSVNKNLDARGMSNMTFPRLLLKWKRDSKTNRKRNAWLFGYKL